MTKHKIEVGFDACGTEQNRNEFVEWLNEQGHDAVAGSTTGSYVDGARDDAAQDTLNELWDAFCNSDRPAAH